MLYMCLLLLSPLECFNDCVSVDFHFFFFSIACMQCQVIHSVGTILEFRRNRLILGRKCRRNTLSEYYTLSEHKHYAGCMHTQ